MIFFFYLLTQVSCFEYLSAVVHSQDVPGLPHRKLWHPHLYLATDNTGDHYEIRHASQYYDVSISFLQTGEEDAPGVMSCECRFVMDEIEEEEETTFLQVMTPSKYNKPEAPTTFEKEISIGSYVPKETKGKKYYDEEVAYEPRRGQEYAENYAAYPEKKVYEGEPQRNEYYEKRDEGKRNAYYETEPRRAEYYEDREKPKYYETRREDPQYYDTRREEFQYYETRDEPLRVAKEYEEYPNQEYYRGNVEYNDEDIRRSEKYYDVDPAGTPYRYNQEYYGRGGYNEPTNKEYMRLYNEPYTPQIVYVYPYQGP